MKNLIKYLAFVLPVTLVGCGDDIPAEVRKDIEKQVQLACDIQKALKAVNGKGLKAQMETLGSFKERAEEAKEAKKRIKVFADSLNKEDKKKIRIKIKQLMQDKRKEIGC